MKLLLETLVGNILKQYFSEFGNYSILGAALAYCNFPLPMLIIIINLCDIIFFLEEQRWKAEIMVK